MPRRNRRITIDDLFRLRTISAADVSPDGERIAFSVSRQDLKKNKAFSSIYVVPARGGRVRRLTRGDQRDGRPRFSPDGRFLAFLSDRDKGTSIWLLPLSGGEPRRLTSRDAVVGDYDWSPDGRLLAVTWRELSEREKLVRDGKTEELSRLPDCRRISRLAYKVDGQGFRPDGVTQIHLVKVSSGRGTALTSGDRDSAEPRFSPDGARVAYLTNRAEDPDRAPENSDLLTVAIDGTGRRRITREPGPVFGHRYAEDGKTIFYLGSICGPGESNLENLHLRKVPAGGGKSLDLTPDLDCHAVNTVIGDTTAAEFGGPAPVLSADGERVYFTATREGACHLGSVSVDGGEIDWTLVGDLTVYGFGGIPGGEAFFALVGDFTSPGELFRFEPGHSPKQLTKINSAVLAGLDLVEPEEVRYPRDEGEVHGWLLRPPNHRPGRKLPAVLEVHGGPHAAYGHVFFHEMQLLAASGYLVLMTNPRGSAGYGRVHRNAIHKDWGSVDMTDLMAALDGLVREEDVDESRVFLTGGSYGGYMTNWLVSHTDRFRAAVTQRSVVNLSSFFGTSDIGYFFGWEFGGPPHEARERYRRMSPLTHASRIDTPLLIIHSEQDLRCPISQAEELFVRLKMEGKEVEFLRFGGESHGLSRGGRPQNRAERLKAILRWFAGHGGNRGQV
jgi:dipeptidyl aminopeptidase/acylaminoacyl peptidase